MARWWHGWGWEPGPDFYFPSVTKRCPRPASPSPRGNKEASTLATGGGASPASTLPPGSGLPAACSEGLFFPPQPAALVVTGHKGPGMVPAVAVRTTGKPPSRGSLVSGRKKRGAASPTGLQHGVPDTTFCSPGRQAPPRAGSSAKVAGGAFLLLTLSST